MCMRGLGASPRKQRSEIFESPFLFFLDLSNPVTTSNMSSSADHYRSPAYDPPPRHSRTNSRSSQASRRSEQLPRYPAEQVEESGARESSEQTLLQQKKAEKEIGRAALDVDGFRFEVSR